MRTHIHTIAPHQRHAMLQLDNAHKALNDARLWRRCGHRDLAVECSSAAARYRRAYISAIH